jgi:hypothetical protein
MATQDLPASTAAGAARLTLSLSVSASGFVGFFTGQRTIRSNAADRLRATLTYAPCSGVEAALRESFLFGVISNGDYIRLPLPHRLTRRGTMAGSPVVTSNTPAGSRTLPITTTAGATLLGGDWIGVGGNLLQCSHNNATASGAGAMSLALVLPTQKAIVAGAAVAYNAPTGVWQIDTDGLEIDYSAPVIQGGIAIPLLQVIL